ncbi:MAG: hypothetical protein QM708_09070 [Propioniciclava sp.]|uniref:hypothetical protein n=1 Tax=Propioniciclava sp. TaxID=2038686 RepID=UPI0039E5EED1
MSDGVPGRRARWLWPVSVLAVGGLGIGAGLALGGANATPEVQPTQPPPTTVVRALELSDTASVECVVHRDSRRIEPPAPPEGSAAIVTRRPLEGTVADEGTILLEVAGRPLILLVGPYPLYRPLTMGDQGDDVKMLQRALNRVRRDIPVTGTFDAATSSSLAGLYRGLGHTAPATPDAGATIARPTELLMVPDSPVTLTRPLPSVGTTLDADLASYYTGQPYASCTTPRIGELVQGAAVAFGDSGVTGTFEHSEETPAAGEASEGSGSSAQARVSLIGDETALADGTSLRGRVTIASTHGRVLAVPVSCLQGGGSSASVTVMRDGNRATVPVQVGLVVDGYAQVTPGSPDGLREGDTVWVVG